LLIRITVSLVVDAVALELAVVAQVLDLVTVPDIVPDALGDLADLVLAVAGDLLRARLGPLRAALVHRLIGGVQRRLPRQLLDLQHGSLARTTLGHVTTPTRFRSRALVLIARRGYVEVPEGIPGTGTNVATTDLTSLMTLMMMMMMMILMVTLQRLHVTAGRQVAIIVSLQRLILLAVVIDVVVDVVVVVVVVAGEHVAGLVGETLPRNRDACCFSRGRRDTGQIRGRLGAMSTGVPPSCTGITAATATTAEAAAATPAASAGLSFASLLLSNDNAT